VTGSAKRRRGDGAVASEYVTIDADSRRRPEGTVVMHDEDVDTSPYRVVMNHAEQHSIWPIDDDLPSGWRDTGLVGTKAECLAYVAEVWSAMRPLIVRRHTG
jgi:MbtH protein